MVKKLALVDFLKKEQDNSGSLSELSRQLNRSGVDITAMKLWRWARDDNSDFPSVEDLEQLAQWKGVELPDFLITYLKYPTITASGKCAALMEQMSLHELSNVAAIANALIISRLESAEKKGMISLENLESLRQILKNTEKKHREIADESGVPKYIVSALLNNPRDCSISFEAFGKLLKFASQQTKQSVCHHSQ